jgi:hypothetical protein
MNQRPRHRRPNRVAVPPGRLQEEIAELQKRLDTLGPDGDCGYENAMIRFYEQELVARRALLNASEPVI